MLKRIAAAFCLAAVLSGPAAAGPALLIDAGNGQVLYAEDIDTQWYPASLTKIMTAYLTFEALKTGKLTLEQKITVSELAHAQTPSKIGLPVGAELSVDLALRALIIKSANDAAVMLAEAISGSEPAFVERMNATAKRLGMTRTTFVNPNGLPAPEQVSTARDLAKLSRAVVADYPEYRELWTLADMRIGRIRIGTHNALLRNYVGADGLKTGFICDSGYNVVASATRDNLRLMAVVLGESTGHERSVRAQALLEHGFNTYGWKTVLNKETIDNVKITESAKDVSSIRTSVMAIECGNRRRVAQQVAQARQRAKARAAKAAAATPAGEPAPATSAAAAAPPPKATSAKPSPSGGGPVATSPPGAAQVPAQPPAQVQTQPPRPKPKPAAPAPAAGGTAQQ